MLFKIKVIRTFLLITILVGLLIGPFAHFSAGERTLPFKVVVHESNPVMTLTKAELSNIFLKKTKKWRKTDDKIQVVDMVDTASVREAFSKIILDRKVQAVKAYWQKQIFSGRDIPPLEKKSEKDIIEFIQENQSGIGYISAETDLADYPVKVVSIIEIES